MRRSPIYSIIIQVLKKNAFLSTLLAVTITGVVILSLMPPQILKLIIDRNLVQRNAENLLKYAAAYIAVVFLMGIIDFAKEAILTVFGQKITKDIRSQMMEKLEKINAMFFTSNGSGAIVSHFTNDVEAINSMFTSGIIGLIIDCFKIVGIIITIWMFSIRLGIATLLLLPFIFGLTRFFQKRMLKAQIENRIIIGKVNNHIAESIKNIRMIKSYSKESYMEKNYVEYLLDNYRTVEKVNFYDAVFSPIIQLARALFIVLIVALSSENLNYLGISLGMVAASIELISNLFAPVENLGMEIQSIQQAISGIHRVNGFFNEPEDDAKNSEITALNIIPHRDEVRLSFNKVSFHYKNGVNILKNIDIKLEPNESVTFAGRTGVGKSTLFKIIAGLLKPTAGSVTINGVDAYYIPNYEKRRIFGYVSQSTSIINGTVAEQVSLRDKSITREQIEKALDFVGLADYIADMENGMDTRIINDGVFSHGQKQLLAIARAIVTDPPILLLDEITANLDSITEEKILSVLRKASGSHAILSISHRLASMIDCDKVIILENGGVKSFDTPERLMQSDDWYRSHVALEKFIWK